MSAERPPVPTWLLGCWRRQWIQFADGTRNDTDHVYWLQTADAMADVRVPADAHDPTRINASTGYTTVDDVSVDAAGNRRGVAQWFTYGVGANYQPECTFPEPGILQVGADGATMIERAPSGAYVEEWALVPGSADTAPRHLVLASGHELFVAGPVAVLAPPSSAAPLTGEFSVALRSTDGSYRIAVSTVAEREGDELDVPA